MKCKKCGFISFDFNQYCPKCNRALSEEQRSLNLPAFRPEPPMLLRRLLGDAYDDADVAVHNTLKDAGDAVNKASDDAKIGAHKAVADAKIAAHQAVTKLKKR